MFFCVCVGGGVSMLAGGCVCVSVYRSFIYIYI